MTRRIKILTVFGTRPEAIKMAPVIKAMQKDACFESRVCVTAQHRQMLDQVLDFFEIKPDYDLDIMRQGQDLYDITSMVITGLRPVLQKEKPDAILVHGDTTTTFAAALASFYAHVPVGHVEAGLRTGNLAAPFPEEANRLLTDRISRFLFAPTETSRENLLKEGSDPSNIMVTGNTVIDAVLMAKDKVMAQEGEGAFNSFCGKMGIDVARRIVLITAHRRESFGGGFENICKAILSLAESFPDVDFIYPVHLNPNVRGPVEKYLAPKSKKVAGAGNIILIDPLDYPLFVFLMNKSHLLLTDSGGVQEEAPSLGKPVLVMRDTTERPEGIQAGTVRLVGTDMSKIIAGVTELLTDKGVYNAMSFAHNPYGDGKASERIISILLRQLERENIANG